MICNTMSNRVEFCTTNLVDQYSLPGASTGSQHNIELIALTRQTYVKSNLTKTNKE